MKPKSKELPITVIWFSSPDDLGKSYKSEWVIPDKAPIEINIHKDLLSIFKAETIVTPLPGALINR